ncbi:MAG: hypothetical protein V4689_10110 [Verrucomicrobiota bacterium]
MEGAKMRENAGSGESIAGIVAGTIRRAVWIGPHSKLKASPVIQPTKDVPDLFSASGIGGLVLGREFGSHARPYPCDGGFHVGMLEKSVRACAGFTAGAGKDSQVVAAGATCGQEMIVSKPLVAEADVFRNFIPEWREFWGYNVANIFAMGRLHH